MKLSYLLFPLIFSQTICPVCAEIEPATPQILSAVADGTPPPPEAPKPVYVVEAADVLESKTHEQGGRSITIQEIKPIALPEPLLPTIPSPADPLVQQHLADHREENSDFEFVFIGATVFRSETAPTRSFVRLQPQGTEAAVSFWSSADFGLLSGFSSFLGSNGKAYSSMMAWGIQNYDSPAELSSMATTRHSAPACPDFQSGPATFTITSENPSADALAIIQSLHDLYHNEFTRLKAAYEGREAARIARETELKNNPPQAKDFTLNFWRIDRASKPAVEQGGAR